MGAKPTGAQKLDMGPFPDGAPGRSSVPSVQCTSPDTVKIHHGDFPFVCLDFVLLARHASLDVVCHPCVHPLPFDVLLGFPDGFISSGVTRQGVVMYFAHDLSFVFVC